MEVDFTALLAEEQSSTPVQASTATEAETVDFSALLAEEQQSTGTDTGTGTGTDFPLWDPPTFLAEESESEKIYVQTPKVPPLLPSYAQSALRQAEEEAFSTLLAETIERVVPSSGRSLQAHQIPPAIHDDPTSAVKGWVMMAGRNAGKSYAGARWLNRMCSVPDKPKRCRIIAPSFGDAVASCVEGPSGVLEASNGQAQWKPSHPGGAQVQWPNGSCCYVIGTPTPRDVDRLRAIGNIDYDWFEEAAANPQLHEAERQARLSRRRLGSKWICTTTPRPLPEIAAWEKDPTVAISAATAFDNPHADPLWLEELETMYAGTRLYDQEVLGKVLQDVAGALWNIGMLERSRIKSLDDAIKQGYVIQKKAVGVDPGNTTGITGIVVVALAFKPSEIEGGMAKRHLLVLEDLSMPAGSAEAWAAAAVGAALRHDCAIVAENDSGGDAIRAVLKGADHLDRVTIIPARARGRGSKDVRAEPVAILWERDDWRGHMVGTDLVQLEDQMTRWVPDDKATAGPSGSPDRVDALVWACTYLWVRNGAEDIDVHLPSHVSGTRQNPLATRPGQMAPWANAGRKKRAGSGHRSH